MPLTLRLDPHAPDPAALSRAARIVAAGGIVVYPTETVYGIGTGLLHPRALERLFHIKHRPGSQPVLLLVQSLADVGDLTSAVPPLAARLAARYWPGPLTMVLPAAAHLPPQVVGPGPGVGCRVSSSVVVQALLAALHQPLTSTSANISGGPDPHSIDQVPPSLLTAADVVIDAGPAGGTAPSTIVDLTAALPRLIRAGTVDLSAEFAQQGSAR